MNSSLLDRVKVQQRRYQSLLSSKALVETTISSAQMQMDKILKQQALLEKSTVALQQAKPLLSASSIKQCEELANTAIASVFELPYTVEYDVESCRFLLNMGNDLKTDLVDSNGGGINSLISFVFNLFLLVKLGKRRFLAYDEAFTAISDAYIERFIEFVRQMCKDLKVDLLLVSHDARISPDDVDVCYQIKDGHSIRIK